MGKHAQESYVSTNFLTQANAASTYAPLASPTFTGTVTVPAPVNTTDAVTKQYADAIAEGLHIHAAVGAATTTNINLSSPPATIDGVTLVDTMRVLVKDQGTTSDNGIYVYNSASSSLTRALDFDTPAETDGGDFVFVTGGNTYDNTGWVQTETVATIGTSPILFTQFSGAGTYTAGTGLSLNGTEFSNTGVVSLIGTANEIEVSASAGSITISLPSTINANTTGSAASLTTSRAIEVTGDVSGSASFNGTANVSISATLANSGVTGASYGSASAVGQFTVDSKGRLTAASNTPIAIAQSAVTNLTTDLSAKANLASPALTGTPTAPTAALGTNTTQIATTEFVESRFDTTTINTQTASYGLVLSDAGKTIEMNVGSANNLTIPLNSSQAFPIGTTIDVIQYGAGQTTIVATGGVTIRSKEGKLNLTGQYSGATLYKRGTDEWVVVGDLTT